MSVFDKPLIQYSISKAQEFVARQNRIQAFVKHNLSSGTANEAILRQFLLEHAPKNIDVGEGFICDPSQKNEVSKQCDILVYDQGTYPLVYSDEPIKVVWPEAAKMVIEVKTQFGKSDIESALENIKSARMINEQIIGVIFAFQSISQKWVRIHLKELLPKISNSFNPMSILLLDKGIIIRRTEGCRYTIYEPRDSEAGSNMVIAYLLLAFFEKIWQSRPKYVDSSNTGSLNIVPLIQELLDDGMRQAGTITYELLG